MRQITITLIVEKRMNAIWCARRWYHEMATVMLIQVALGTWVFERLLSLEVDVQP